MRGLQCGKSGALSGWKKRRSGLSWPEHPSSNGAKSGGTKGRELRNSAQRRWRRSPNYGGKSARTKRSSYPARHRKTPVTANEQEVIAWLFVAFAPTVVVLHSEAHSSWAVLVH